MRILVHEEINNDLSLCKKKKRYSGIEKELPRIYRLLKIQKKIPGEYPVKDLTPEWNGKVKHAKISLPKEKCGGSKGGRVVYVFVEDRCQILYVGGHKDKRYDNPYKLSNLITERLEATAYMEWIDY